MPARTVPPLFWIEQQQRGFSEDDLEGLSKEEQDAAIDELADEDLEDPPPFPNLGKRNAERILCLFSTEKGAWDFFNDHYTPGRVYLTGEPIAIDDFQVASADNVDDLLALCERADAGEGGMVVGATGFAIDPPADFLDKYSADLALDLTQIRETIWRVSEEPGGAW